VASKKKYISSDFYPLKKILEEGKVGFRENLTNPYSYGTSRCKEWERGFNKSYFGRLKEVKSFEAYSTVPIQVVDQIWMELLPIQKGDGR
jgi:hypothetical protein